MWRSRCPLPIGDIHAVDVDVGARLQAAQQLLAGAHDDGVTVADQHRVEVEGQQLAARQRRRRRILELVVHQQGQAADGGADDQITGQHHAAVWPAEGDLAGAGVRAMKEALLRLKEGRGLDESL